jgi:hypothetical protein
LRERCVPGTVDAVIFGGNYFFDEEASTRAFRINYNASINSLSSEIFDVLGFTPPVIAGPKTYNGGDSVYFDNENRRLYIVRPKVGDSSTESYLPKDLKEQEKKWQAKE